MQNNKNSTLSMDAIKTLLVHQYSLVQDARKVLFEFLASISKEDFLRTSEHVGNGGCIKNLLIHTCNSYVGWLSHFAFGRPYNKVAFDSFNQLSSCAEYFSKVDVMVEEFIHAFENRYEQSITGTIANGTRTVTSTPLKVFMHAVTHEFHHKGQILVLSRMWGYTPVDTDIQR